MMREESLGIYSGFPERCHHAFFLGINVPVPDVQKALVCMMHELNGRSVKNQWSRSVGTDIDVIFEFGVADGLTFHYINSDMLNLLLKIINEREIRILDFICIIRYYMRGVRRNGKRRALRFDHYFLRFIFSNRHLKIRVFHEKGPQRISAKEIIEFLVKNISPALTDETDVSG